MNSQRSYLLRTLDAIDAVIEYTQDGRDAFFADRMTQDAVIRNIEILGQAVKGLSTETRAHDDSIPWRQIAGMRDKLIHEYLGADLAVISGVVERDLPALRLKLAALQEHLTDQVELIRTPRQIATAIIGWQGVVSSLPASGEQCAYQPARGAPATLRACRIKLHDDQTAAHISRQAGSLAGPIWFSPMRSGPPGCWSQGKASLVEG
ncbi:DUF86 domain-containing protein [Conexibacter sp. S30A1]|uniref:HepT-like ribonuclease domain-containing protein n=1 Tax=Conexibacter sp. S30A1 TaxID=2937800 RepID=UPI00200D2556|nr:DUF86 domain-containing protein [Conexibacter sp. S30A1]